MPILKTSGGPMVVFFIRWFYAEYSSGFTMGTDLMSSGNCSFFTDRIDEVLIWTVVRIQKKSVFQAEKLH